MALLTESANPVSNFPDHRPFPDDSMSSSDYYTYLHRTSSGQVFYVGKGRGKRAFSRHSRNPWWVHVINKHGLRVEVVLSDVGEADALAHERFLVASFRVLGARLVNMTEGGDSAPSKSIEVRAKISAALAGKPKAKRCRERTGSNHHAFGKPVADATKSKLSAALRGRFTGADHPRSRPVVCIDTGLEFSCARDAVIWLRANGHPKASAGNLCSALSGARPAAYGLQWRFSTGSQLS